MLIYDRDKDGFIRTDRFRIEMTLSKRKCHNCGEPIPKGNDCIVHKNEGHKSNLCFACLQKLIHLLDRITDDRKEIKHGTDKYHLPCA